MKQQGFNLIELALALAIIAMITGGLLKGLALVENAKLNRLVSLHTKITQVVYSYVDRYGYLPGDDPETARRWYQNDARYNGNGQGIIEGKFDASSDEMESRKLWGHLRAAGLINGRAKDLRNPSHPFGGVVGVSSELGPFEIEVYIGYTKVPTDVLEQLSARVGLDAIPIRYSGPGASDSMWTPCDPLPADARTVDVIFTNQNPCNR